MSCLRNLCKKNNYYILHTAFSDIKTEKYDIKNILFNKIDTLIKNKKEMKI